MGTPEYAVASLEAVSANHEIVGVLTRADKPNKRGNKIQFSPVKEFAISHNIPVFQPEKLNDDVLMEEIASLNPDIATVVAYGMIIPKRLIDLPPLGTINVHGSLLPQYRGAAPMQYSVLNGDKEAGVTIMYVEEALDAGDIVLQKKIPVGDNETFGELHDRLSILGAEALVEAIKQIETGTSTRTKQNSEKATFAPSISKEECIVNWNLSADNVHNRIRGLSPIPCANTHLPDGKLLKIYRSEKIDGYFGKPGEIVDVLKKKGIVVTCGTGAVCITSAKPEGKREMPGFELINGHYVSIGDILSSP
ncbi:MAG TPA: methionyl-tRNA formyltransferase [Methanocorpusculum sp.]|nr:methionyl-tRNA formyltransferase [Methanocorpusculum sp.]